MSSLRTFLAFSAYPDADAEKKVIFLVKDLKYVVDGDFSQRSEVFSAEEK